MALPCYVSTEWEGLGHATLRFRPKKVQVVVREDQTAGEDGSTPHPDTATSSWWPGFWSNGVPWFFSPKDQPLVETHKIECYLSAVYIGEYGERKSKVSQGCKKTSKPQEAVEEAPPPSNGHEADLGDQSTVQDNSLTHLEGDMDDLRPPGIESEVWDAWLYYWAAWKEVLIPLSWIHKYREHCTPDFITWHDSYLKDYPEILPLITEELGVSEVHKDTTETNKDTTETNRDTTETNKDTTEINTCQDTSSDSEFDMTEFYDFLNGDGLNDSMTKPVNGEPGMNEEPDCMSGGNAKAAVDGTTGESENRKVLDDLYTKHTTKRYLVHLRSFLHSSGVESSQDLDTFFVREAGIDFNVQTEVYNADMNATELSEGDTQGRNEDGIINTSLAYDKENEEKSPQQMKDIRDVTTETSVHEELDLNTSSVHQELGESGRKSHHKDLPCEDKRTEPHASEAAVVRDSSGNEENEHEEQTNTHNASTSSSQEHKTSKRKRKNKDTIRPQGTSWALKYIKTKTVSQSEQDIPQSPEMSSVSLDYPEAALRPSSVSLESTEAVSGPLEASSGNPDAVPGPSSMSLESPEAVPGSLEVSSGNPEAVPQSSEKKTDRTSDAEAAAMQVFFDIMHEDEKLYWKRYLQKQERDAVLRALQKPPTRLAKLLAVCYATLARVAVSLEDVLLPFTGIHLLNVAFPGAAVVEYENSITEEVPGERKRLRVRFDSFMCDQRIKLERYLSRIKKFCLTTLKDIVVPIGIRHLTKLAILTVSETEQRFPPSVFGVRWLPLPEPSFCGDVKNIKRQQRRFHRWLEAQNPNMPPSCTVQLRGLVMHRVNPEPDPRKPHRVYQQVVKEEGKTQDSRPNLTAHTLHPLSKTGEGGGSNVHGEAECPAVEITFDKDGNFCVGKNDITSEQTQNSEEAEVEAWNEIITGCQRVSYWEKDNTLPSDLPKEIHKYWAQRYRLFLKYDQGIRLDNESWYSVTPEFLAAHQALRCRCEVAVDAMCGAGGNAIQLAKTCGRVIAIDKDPRKVELARHNAQVYGVADRIDFRVGNFFKLASYLKADVVYLSPPWGGMEYLEEWMYNVYRLGGTMNCAGLLRAARSITPNVALYLPRNSDLSQVIVLACVDGTVDIETTFMGPKKKAITAYFGDLAAKGF